MQNSHSQASTEVARGDRFEFGSNWSRFLSVLSEERISEAERSLKTMLGVTDLSGKRFLDAGSGSGIFSLAARRLGARVHSFDYDQESVRCAEHLRQTYFKGDPDWTVESGSVLDKQYLETLGTFDVVYSWGVLHHTGAMWEAIDNVARLTAPKGEFFMSIYNDQGSITAYWTFVKRLYNKRHWSRPILIGAHAPYVGARIVSRWLKGSKQPGRGMSIYYDMIDWLGGYPFETASPAQIIAFLRNAGFVAKNQKLCGARHGCNEFVFVRGSA